MLKGNQGATSFHSVWSFLFPSHCDCKPLLHNEIILSIVQGFQWSISSRQAERELAWRMQCDLSLHRIWEEFSTLALTIHTQRSSERGRHLLVFSVQWRLWWPVRMPIKESPGVSKCARISSTSSVCKSLCAHIAPNFETHPFKNLMVYARNQHFCCTGGSALDKHWAPSLLFKIGISHAFQHVHNPFQLLLGRSTTAVFAD